MIEFIKQLVDNEYEFFAIAIFLNKAVKNIPLRIIYIPKQFHFDDEETKSRIKRKSYKYFKLSDFHRLYENIEKFSPNTAQWKITSLLRNFGGQKVYIPTWHRMYLMIRDEQIVKYRQVGFSYQELRECFNISFPALSKILAKDIKAKESADTNS